MTKSQIRKTLSDIRQKHPGEDIGDHWEGVGVYLGDGVWADPEWIGMPGELELLKWPTRLYNEP